MKNEANNKNTHLNFFISNNVSSIFFAHFQVKLNVILVNNNTIQNMFKIKDLTPRPLRSNIIYKYCCGADVPSGTCNATYIGKTHRHFATRIAEHRGRSVRTNSVVGNPLFSSIRNHAFEHGHAIERDNFSIVTSARSNYDLEILEALAIYKLKPSLNEQRNFEVLGIF